MKAENADYYRGYHAGLERAAMYHESRPDVSHVDVIDCIKHTTERRYPVHHEQETKQ